MDSVLRPPKRCLLMIVAILVTAVGCGDTAATSPPARPTESPEAESPEAPLATPPADSSTPASGPPPPAVDPPPAQDSPPAAPAATTGAIVLQGNGLGLVTFAEPESTAVERLTALLGAPTKEDRARPDCPLDRTLWWGALAAGFQDGKFVSYLASNGPGGEYRTTAGIGPGSTLAQIQQAYGPDLPEGPDSNAGSFVLKTDTGDIYAFMGDVIFAGARNLATLTAGPRC